MQKFKQGKKLIISLLCLMLIVLASVLCANTYINRNEQEEIKNTYAGTDYSSIDPSNIYDFANGAFDNKNSSGYNKSYFSISNYKELLNFSTSVANGYTFYGKTVYLQSDISGDLNTKWVAIGAKVENKKYFSSSEFSGTFDGNNHMIWNLYSQIDSSQSNSYIPMGLFAKIKGTSGFYDLSTGTWGTAYAPVTIKNVRLAGMELKNYNSNWAGFHMSGLVAVAEGACIIENCIVEDVTLKADKEAHDDHFGAIVCEYSKTNDFTNIMAFLRIKDCLVTGIYAGNYGDLNFSTLGPVKKHDAEYARIDALEWVASSELIEKSRQYLESVYGFWPEDGSCWYAKDGIMKLTEKALVKTDYVLRRNCDSEDWTEETVSNPNFIEGNISVREKFANSKAWYIPNTKEYNAGCPYLISYMQFKTIKFQSDGDGVVSPEKIVIPDSLAYAIPRKSMTFILYGTEVSATPNDGYVFGRWSEEDDDLYEAVFIQEKYTLNFQIIDEYNTIIDCGLSAPLELEVRCGQTYTIRNYYIYDGSYLEVGEERICHLDRKYMFDSIVIGDKEMKIYRGMDVKIPDLGRDGGTYTAIIKVKLKSYSVEVS